MPGMTGLDLLEWVRRDEHYRNVPFMMLTAETNRDQIRTAMAAGVTEYMVKPFTVNTFSGKFMAMFDPRRPVRMAPQPAAAAPAATPAPVPAARPAGPAPALSSTQVVGLDAPLDERLKRSTVLVVDDVASNIEVIADVLKDDYTIKVAISGKKALELAETKAPDIILLDIMMPEMDGFEVCRKLKANAATAEIPIIFLSAKDQPDDVVGGLELGAVDYVVKPIAPTILKARMRTHLRLATALKDLKRQHAMQEDIAVLREDVERMTRHDLKNPLGAILQASQSLLEGAAPLTQAQRDSAQLIEDSVSDALGMVNLSLDLYKMEMGTYLPSFQTVGLEDVLARIVKETQVQFEWKRLSFQLDTPGLFALGERLLYISLFGNLIKNAAEAAPNDSVIDIRGAASGGNCVVTVENLGAVPAEMRPRFFEKYATQGKEGGTGLGTYSAKLMVEVMGGTIAMSGDDQRTKLTVNVTSA
jgi:DNA-binding response OmpR family regulator